MLIIVRIFCQTNFEYAPSHFGRLKLKLLRAYYWQLFIKRILEMQYDLLSRDELIQLQYCSVAAVNVFTALDLDRYFLEFTQLFPYEQLAIAAYYQEGAHYRLKSLYNKGFPAEREASFKKARTLNSCQALHQTQKLHVNSWRHKGTQETNSIGSDSIKYGIKEGLYGVIKPARNLVGILCSMSGDDLAKNPRHNQLLSCMLPHLQLAQSTVLNTATATFTSEDVTLTQREYEVLAWLCGGKTNWELSRILNISEHTVKFHITNLSQKLGANNRAHIVALGTEKLGMRYQ